MRRHKSRRIAIRMDIPSAVDIQAAAVGRDQRAIQDIMFLCDFDFLPVKFVKNGTDDERPLRSSGLSHKIQL